MLICAVANGVMRESLFSQWFPESALPVSGLVLSVLIVLICYVGLPWFGRLARWQVVYIGSVWVLMTLSLETLMVVGVQGRSVSAMSELFDVANGNLYSVVILSELVSPAVVARVKGWF